MSILDKSTAQPRPLNLSTATNEDILTLHGAAVLRTLKLLAQDGKLGKDSSDAVPNTAWVIQICMAFWHTWESVGFDPQISSKALLDFAAEQGIELTALHTPKLLAEVKKIDAKKGFDETPAESDEPYMDPPLISKLSYAQWTEPDWKKMVSCSGSYETPLG